MGYNDLITFKNGKRFFTKRYFKALLTVSNTFSSEKGLTI